MKQSNNLPWLIWIIGFLFTFGMMIQKAEELTNADIIGGAIFAIIGWPFLLGLMLG